MAAIEGYQFRAIASLLATVPEPSLPSQIPIIVTALHASPVLEGAFHSAASKNDEATSLLTRFKARVSSLIQARTPQARWCGAALAKASIESSEECLAEYAKTWVPLLINLLSRPEPRATHILVLASCSRIFNLMTLDRPSLAREVTSPNLKPFLEGLITLSSTEDPHLLTSCLRATAQTLAAHPTTFRPFQKKTLALVVNILSRSAAGTVPPVTEELAREVYVNLHLCAAARSSGNDGNGEQRLNASQSVAIAWSTLLKSTVAEAHVVLDTVFAPILESPEPPPPPQAGTETTPILTPETPAIARATLLLRLLSTFFILPTSSSVTIPITPLLTLTNRILAALPPPHHSSNPAHPRADRDALFTNLPLLHTHTISLLNNIFTRLGALATPLITPLLQHIATIFPYISPPATATTTPLRRELYILTNTLLLQAGPGIPKQVIRIVSKNILTTAANDILKLPSLGLTSGHSQSVEASTTIGNQSIAVDATMGTHIASNQSLNRAALSSSAKRAKLAKKGQGNNIPRNAATLADSFTVGSTPSGASSLATSTTFTPPTNATSTHLPPATTIIPKHIHDLLLTSLTALPTGYIPSETRTLIDRTLVLAGDVEGMLASVLFPGSYVRASILPHLVGGLSGGPPRGAVGLGVHGVVWPRLPIVRLHDEDDEDEDEAEDDDDDDDEQSPATDNKHTPTTIPVETLESRTQRLKSAFTPHTPTPHSPHQAIPTPQTPHHDHTLPPSTSTPETPRRGPLHADNKATQGPGGLDPLTPSVQLFQQQRLHLASQRLREREKGGVSEVDEEEEGGLGSETGETPAAAAGSRRRTVETVEVVTRRVVETTKVHHESGAGASERVEEDDEDDGEDMVMPDIDMGQDTESDTESDDGGEEDEDEE